MEAHDHAVSIISSQVRQFHSARKPYRIYHGSTNSTRDSRRDPSSSIDTSKLNHVLDIDTTSQIATVEPNVPMDDFVRATYARGLVPLVVMEFPGITVGGGFAGTSGESSSFRHGFFDNTVTWIEVVIPTGEVRRVGREADPELFWGAAGSFGTLGVVTLLKVRLREAKKFVGLTYYPFADMDAAMRKIESESADREVDYLDGIVFARDNIVICSGKLTDSLPPSSPSSSSSSSSRSSAELVHFTRPQDRWFYQHVQHRTSPGQSPVTIYTPLADYLFRYDRGAFWVARYAFQYFLTPFNRVTRYLLDHFMHTRVMYHALHESGQARIYIIQDVAIPYPHATTFHHWLDDTFALYPLWLCPLRQRRDDGPAARHGLYADLADPATSPEFMLNFGIWGPGSPLRRDFLRQNRALERKVAELQGRKWLYAHAYYTEEEFWQIYDRAAYEALRKKFGAEYLPGVFEKVRVDLDEGRGREEMVGWWAWVVVLFWGIWPLSGLWGVWRAWRGGEYLLQKKKKSGGSGSGSEGMGMGGVKEE